VRLAGGIEPPGRADHPVVADEREFRLPLDPPSAAGPNRVAQDLTGLVGPASRRRPLPPQVAVRHAPPLGILRKQGGERCRVAAGERFGGRAQLLDHAAKPRLESLMGVEAPATTRVRLAELVAALSLGIDLGFGQPMEHVLRQCLIALRLAEGVGLDEQQRAVVYYTALLVNVGCHSDAHEQAKWFGDDIASKSIKYDHELRSLRMTASGLRFFGSGHPPLHRFKLGLEFVLSGHREVNGMIEAHAAIARTLGEQLGLQEDVLVALAAAYETWDGRGWPGKLAGEEVPLASRLAQLAEFAEVAYRVGGVDGVRKLVRKRRGKQFDPKLADLVAAEAEIILAGIESTGTWDAVIDAEPALAITLTGERFEAALLAVANFIDLKSPYFLGHASAVSDLAAATASALGSSEADVVILRRAGLVHDFGRLGISNAIWDKRGPLGSGEWERLRLHPYLTERMLRQSGALAPLAAIAVQHRERLDGSGYPRGLSGVGISRPARILGAVDAYEAMREPRPHRPALSADDAAAELRGDARAGRYDVEVVEAVLGAAGHRVSRRYEGPAGLTAREIEVLRLLARGFSNKQIAKQLVISPKTVATHAEHIYAKINAPSRAAAGLYAMQHGLLPEEALA
jgi:HD-GYP domain-containing protein (c-di-GMP phosphodiesterase class II)